MMHHGQQWDVFGRGDFDKNAAADFLSSRLGRLISSDSVRMLHYRGSCRAVGRYADGRLKWSRERLESYIAFDR